MMRSILLLDSGLFISKMDMVSSELQREICMRENSSMESDADLDTVSSRMVTSMKEIGYLTAKMVMVSVFT